MRVKELVAELQKYDGELQVVVADREVMYYYDPDVTFERGVITL